MPEKKAKVPHIQIKIAQTLAWQQQEKFILSMSENVTPDSAKELAYEIWYNAEDCDFVQVLVDGRPHSTITGLPTKDGEDKAKE